MNGDGHREIEMENKGEKNVFCSYGPTGPGVDCCLLYCHSGDTIGG